MSAWIVNREHIDLMLKAGFAHVNAGEIQGHRLSWFTEDPKEVGYGQAYQTRRELRFDTADEVGQMLWTENVCSVSARYPDDSPATRPGPISEDIDGEAIGYTYRDPHYVPTYAEVFKILSCYEYQSCEHDGWETSEAKRFCDILRDEIVGLISEGPWGWDSAELQKARSRQTTDFVKDSAVATNRD